MVQKEAPMITIENLKKVDSSFAVCSQKEDDAHVTTLCSIENSRDGGLIFIKDRKYYNRMITHFANGSLPDNIGVILQESFYKLNDSADQLTSLNRFRFFGTVDSVDFAMSRFSKLFYDAENSEPHIQSDGRKSSTARIHPSSFVADNVYLGERVKVEAEAVIHPGCVILADSCVGRNTILYPNVVIYRNVHIGQNCIIHANTTLGADGFRFVFSKGVHHKVWHLGGVIIEDDVEIGANSSIDQGTFSPTVIGQGSKLDNQVHIAHNCRLGKGAIICGQTGLAGSVTLGDYVVVGGAVNIAPGANVGSYAQIGGMSGVTGNVPEKAVYGGHPARPLNEWLKTCAMSRRMAQRQTGHSEKN